MEYVGNQIKAKSVGASLIGAFFVGRICFFEETFPAAVALITVMMAVSSLYIYFVPVLWAAMWTFTGQGLVLFGDFFAVLILGVFFAFFHQRKFTMNQRTTIAVMVTIFSHCIYACAKDCLFLLQPEVLLKEAIAVMVYLRVWNLMAKLIFIDHAGVCMSREKVELALEISVVSIIGSIGRMEIVLPLWCIVIVAVLLHWGIREAFSVTALCGIFWICQGDMEWENFPVLFGGILAGWYGAMTVDMRYRKTVIAAAMFIAAGLSDEIYQGLQVYSVALGMMLVILLPDQILTKCFCLVEERFMPEFSTLRDLQILQMRKNLLKKREAFLRLSRLYSRDFGGKEIISFQFMGMARTIESLLKDLEGKSTATETVRNEHEQGYLRISTAQSSYACGQISGDSMAAFEISPYLVALVLSDGMGKGKKAAEESNFVVETLSQLLQAGFDVDVAMKTINGILMTDNEEERFATVDLTMIDRKQGRAKIFKMGAASTFIKHDGKISMMKRQALPAGITDGLKLEYLEIKLKRGDILIMVSDGITDCDRGDPNGDWLRERLLEIHSKDPETIAELILHKAAEKYGVRERDDLSVLVAAIEG